MKQTTGNQISTSTLRTFGLNPDQWLLIENDIINNDLRKNQIQFCHIDETDFRLNATIKGNMKNKILNLEIQKIEFVL